MVLSIIVLIIIVLSITRLCEKGAINMRGCKYNFSIIMSAGLNFTIILCVIILSAVAPIFAYFRLDVRPLG
jgi:hypothetical protein